MTLRIGCCRTESVGTRRVLPALLVPLMVACSSSNGVEAGENQTNQNVPTPSYNVSDAGEPDYNGGLQQVSSQKYAELSSQACGRWTGTGESVPTLIEFVVDTSGSMQSTAPSTGSKSKWQITQTALKAAISSMDNDFSVGILFYPNRETSSNLSGWPEPVSSCVDTTAMIPVQQLGGSNSAHRLALAASIDAVKPVGGTPTHDAYDFALSQGLKPSDVPARRYMVLVTDGQPTLSMGCMGSGNGSSPADYHPIVAEIVTAHASGVDTFVIGAPGSERNDTTKEDVRYWLSEAARAGGTSVSSDCDDSGAPNYCHFDMSVQPDFAQGFSAALAKIAAQVTTCTYRAPAPPSGQQLDFNAVNVFLKSGTNEYYLVLRDKSANCSQGWYLDAENNIVLCKDTCTKYRSDQQSSVELRFGCATLGSPVT